ncbi:cellulose biosynthesis protein BcsO [Klebsiella quasipneumoniae]|uniref:cellulose biosynthesis protein BcsO n=1 Tax=Klebsiella quasipneumoniae TaxID=1463165 RepID=UPI000C7C105D|nr:cellulose biosynthesis protein BcsO [Klebsiella quasipneumoniae]MCS4385206.1 cellulose biosynthesis protein BcsO [Klebsiella quasipneumoniae subsp. similipneumoniae]MCS4411593.1 cellulose biosynthesis protein BcsO [Klebsiella quasipneumoniae subsp. similipneumoniae]PLD64574.1 cellulose biosynthesis protein BcsO [Klebsiella quasipneumoniae]PLF06107.1 cellulose biosynthesis protein BcsO [Klebsiella quasipneumoniae]HDU5305103.1 cellulose biosynthesis protein BcsO [Klebsiella quasipneumoniae su
MNHYDDLQRFQEKTRTQNLKFQDLSSQAATREHGDWAILNQLNPGAEKPSSLALGGSVSAPLPQSVPADLFHQIEAAVAAAPASASVVPAAPVAPAAPQPAVETATAAPEPVRQEPAVTPAPSIPAPEPAMAPPRMAPRPAPTAENYAHLFAAKSAEPVAKNKDQPLKSLLERIATCR